MTKDAPINLPPLPPAKLLRTVMPDDFRYGHVYGFRDEDLRDYARAAVLADRAGREELKFFGQDKDDPVRGASLPMIPESWRYKIVASFDSVSILADDNGPWIPWAVHSFAAQQLADENLRLRKIACHVPAREYIKAKEAAGYGDQICAAAPSPAEPPAAPVQQEPVAWDDCPLLDHINDLINSACSAWSDVRDKQGNIIEWKCEFAAALESRLRGHIAEYAKAITHPDADLLAELERMKAWGESKWHEAIALRSERDSLRAALDGLCGDIDPECENPLFSRARAVLSRSK